MTSQKKNTIGPESFTKQHTKITRIRSGFSSEETTLLPVTKYQVLEYLCEAQTRGDLPQVSTHYLKQLAHEGVIEFKSATELEWEVSEIRALKGFIQSVQEQIFPLRRQSIFLTKKLLHHTSKISKDSTEIVQQLLRAKNQIETMEHDMEIFENQLKKFRESIKGYKKAGGAYIKITRAGRSVFERMKRFKLSEVAPFSSVPLFHS